MKRKTFLTIMTLLLTIVMLTACGKGGKHNYSEEYTITFDSKGGSAVQPVKASAGAAITARPIPPKTVLFLRVGTKVRTEE